MPSIIDRLKFPVIVIIIGLLIFYGFTKLFGPIPFSVTSVVTNQNDLFTVEGVGEVTGIPDTAQISVGVTKTASTVEQAQNQTNSAINAITDGFKELGIKEEDIKTSNYNVNPNIDYTSGSQRTTGYTVSVNLDVKIKDTDKANQALDLATKNGANVVGGVTFVLSDEDQEELEKEAREKAIADAKEKAREISSEAGIRLGRITNVYVNPYSDPMPYERSLSAAPMDAMGGNETKLQPGQNVVKIMVSLSYETL